MAILTSRDHSHLTWQFSPHVTIPTSHGNSHLAWPFPPRVAILTLRDHSHLAWQFSPCMTIPTSFGNSHLAWPFPPHVASMAILTSRTFSPRMLPSTPQSHHTYTHEVHEVTLHYIKRNSRNFHHSQLGHHWSNIYTVQKSHLALRVSVELSPPPLKVTSCAYSHLTYTFSPHVHILNLRAPLHHSKSPRIHILTSCTHSYLVYTFSLRIHILTSCAPSTTQSHLVPISSTHSHLVYIFPPRVPPSTIQSHLTYTFSPRIHIPTSRTYSHPACHPPPFKVTSHTHSHLAYTFSPHIHILTSRAPSTTQSHLMPISSTHSQLAYIFSPHVLPSTQNNIFHLAWKNSQKSHAATPIPSIRYLLRATNYGNLPVSGNRE